LHLDIRNPRIWLGVAVSVAALYLALKGVSWRDLRAHLLGADYIWLLPALGVVVLGQAARAIRWRVLFGNGPKPGFEQALAILSVGYLVSAVFQLRLGDPVRAWLVQTRAQGGGYEAFATVMVERVIDLLTLITLLAVAVPRPAARLLGDQLGPGPWSDPGRLSLLALGVVAAAYAGIVAFSFAGARVGRLFPRPLRRLGLSAVAADAVGGAVARFAAGFAPLRRPRIAMTAMGWSLIVWCLGALSYWLIMAAFRLHLPFTAALFAMCGTGLFAILPSSPGYAGVFHLGIRIALGIVAPQVPVAAVEAYAIVLHGVTILLLIVLGLIGMARLGLTRDELGRRVEAVAVDA
jgi:uncharacterized membrane protein YbhN (UPF0104 family)